ncbi:MAG TPA: TetR/AcrR family transcriptional regulator [Beijerinckiaceae bacterium]|nr:TetR/AcrR family transcriptional regulator [Beijerinckiaceae bacterium]
MPPLVELEAPVDRRARILDAAERCFVRAGFHRTTMQDVAAEAGMSPGNLYRYFPSKDAIVAGLCERDRAQIAEDFASMEGGADFMETFARLGRKHFEEEPREKAVLCLEIWAEATRNAAVNQVSREFDCDLVGRLTALFTQAQARGFIASRSKPEALAVLIATLANGMFVRRAVAPNFDPELEVGAVMAVIGAALKGDIDLAPTAVGRKLETV